VDAGVDKDLVFGDPTAPRFVFWEKKLRATPSGPDALTFDLLSIWGKIRAGLGAVGIVKGGPMPGVQRWPAWLQHGAVRSSPVWCSVGRNGPASAVYE
jgi:hypothetical protein